MQQSAGQLTYPGGEMFNYHVELCLPEVAHWC